MASETETRQERIWTDLEPEVRASSSVPVQPEVKGRARLELVNRQQMVWRTIDVERLIEEEAIGAVEGRAGRPALDPQLLISVWIYAYSEGVGSAREIARLCEYHPAYQWLTGLETINYHSLSDFRVEHQAALDELFTQVLGLLSAEGLVTLQRVMHDGTKVSRPARVRTPFGAKKRFTTTWRWPANKSRPWETLGMRT